MRRTVILAATALALTAGIVGTVYAQQSASYRMERSVIAGGGGVMTSSSYRIEGTVGQHAAGPPFLESTRYRISGGFWQTIPTARHPAIFRTAGDW